MKKNLCIASIIALPLLAFALDAPANFNAVLNGDIMAATWDPVAEATKYSVCIVAEYDTTGDGVADQSVDYDFGTSDRTDGELMSAPFLNIPLAELTFEVDVNEDGIYDTLMGAMARVKALNPGKGNKRQNNPFSPFVVFYPPAP